MLEQDYELSGRVPNYQQYWLIRKHTGGTQPILNLAEYATRLSIYGGRLTGCRFAAGVSLTTLVRQSPDYQILLSSANRIINL